MFIGLALASLALSIGTGSATTASGAALGPVTRAPAGVVHAGVATSAGPTRAEAAGSPATSDLDLTVEGLRPLGTTLYYGNWAGYATSGEKYTYAYGAWRVPQVDCAAKENSSSVTWVGLDGLGDKSVEQLGTSSICTDGKPLYGAWWEMVPQNALQPIDQPVEPGDSMVAYVTSNVAGTQYTLVIKDETRDWTSSTTATASPADDDATAEWITERPACGASCAKISNFGTVTFSRAVATGKGRFGAVGAFPNSPIDMANGGTLDASVGGLTDGSAFDTYWQHS
jgi:hypothetical protein